MKEMSDEMITEFVDETMEMNLSIEQSAKYLRIFIKHKAPMSTDEEVDAFMERLSKAIHKQVEEARKRFHEGN